MEIGNILDAIWNLPWHKVLVIAIADDAILFLKLWWLWAIILIITIISFISFRKKKSKGL